MTGIEILLAFYIGGWMGTSSLLVQANCHEELYDRPQCVTASVLAGAKWPLGVEVADDE